LQDDLQRAEVRALELEAAISNSQHELQEWELATKAARSRLQASGHLSEGTKGQKTGGRPAKLTVDFVEFAGRLWRKAKADNGGRSVSSQQLSEIASELDQRGYKDPSRYLTKRCATELKNFNSRNSNSKTGPIKTWSALVSKDDKDHLRAMRKLLSFCANRKLRPEQP